MPHQVVTDVPAVLDAQAAAMRSPGAGCGRAARFHLAAARLARFGRPAVEPRWRRAY